MNIIILYLFKRKYKNTVDFYSTSSSCDCTRYEFINDTKITIFGSKLRTKGTIKVKADKSHLADGTSLEALLEW